MMGLGLWMMDLDLYMMGLMLFMMGLGVIFSRINGEIQFEND